MTSNHFDVIYNWRNWVQPYSTAYATVSNSGFTSGSNSFFRDRFMIASWDKVIGNEKLGIPASAVKVTPVEEVFAR